MPASSRTQPEGRRSARAFDSLEQEAFLNLWRTYDRLKLVEEELFGRYELTAQQYNALRLLRSVHPQTLPTLAVQARLVSRAPDITRLLDRLEARGLVTRDRSHVNRRVVQVGLTEAGLALLKELAVPLAQCHRRQLGHLSDRDLQCLVQLLNAARAPHEDAMSVWSPVRSGNGERRAAEPAANEAADHDRREESP
jgi:DNA-binding MarR family transcriptional regulator